MPRKFRLSHTSSGLAKVDDMRPSGRHEGSRLSVCLSSPPKHAALCVRISGPLARPRPHVTLTAHGRCDWFDGQFTIVNNLSHLGLLAAFTATTYNHEPGRG